MDISFFNDTRNQKNVKMFKEYNEKILVKIVLFLIMWQVKNTYISRMWQLKKPEEI